MIMESKWMSGCGRSDVYTIPAHYLAASTNIFSESFICRLGHDLEANKEQLARELGFSPTSSAADGLYSWCSNQGSTVFVLVSVLGNLGRADCVHVIEQYIQSQAMQLFVKVEEALTDVQPVTAAPRFHQVITCCEFSLLKALENVLGSDLVYYEIVGPGAWVMWTTLAKELKGQQLTVLHHSQPVSSTRAALCDPMEQETELKKLVVTHNIPGNSAAELDEETHLKVLECTQIENLKYSHEPSIQVSNSNNLTLSDSLNQDKISPRSLSVEGPTKTHSHLSADSKNYHFSLDGQTHVKMLVVDRQNTPGVQVVKYFPDKLLYEDSTSKRNNQNVEASQAHPQLLLDNVPRLSLLEGEFSSLSPNIDQPVTQPAQQVQQSKLNDLSCVVPSFGKHFVDLQTFPKTPAHENVRFASVPRQTDKLSPLDNSSYLDLVTQIPALSEINVSELEMSRAASSLFALGPNAQFCDVEMSCAGHDYLPHTHIKSLSGHLEHCGSAAENNPKPCGNCRRVSASPQLRHQVMQSSLASAEQQLGHLQAQQETLLDVADMKSRQLRLQKLQRQQAFNLPLMSPFNSDLQAATDCNSPSFLPQEIFRQNSDQHLEPQQYRPDASQTSFNHQAMMYNHQDPDHQSFHLSDMSQHDDQQHNQLYSEQDIQSSTSPFIKPNASRYLICHTPPPGFPDEQTQDDHHLVSEAKEQYRPPRNSSSSSATEEFNDSSQFLDKLSQMTNLDAGSEQYMTMFQPTVHVMGNSSFKALSVKSQSSMGHPSTLQNLDLSSNNLPAHTPHNPRNPVKSVISSDSSGGSSECPVFIYSQPFPVFTEGHHSFMTPKPFHPAPLMLDALGRQINSSMPNDHQIFRASFRECGQSRQDGYSPPSGGHLTRSKSLPIHHFHSKPMVHTRSMETRPHVENLEVDLLSLEGWNPYVNGDTIQDTMDKFKSPDGNYIIWKSRRHKNFVISVSYLNQLFHFRVEEVTSQNSESTVYYLFEGGYSSVSLLDLVQHYRQNGIRISMQSAGKQKTYIENIRLLCPLKVKSQMIRQGTSKSK
ncbi:hypothetical protein BsWGS_13739 [Bradybaena similaris]